MVTMIENKKQVHTESKHKKMTNIIGLSNGSVKIIYHDGNITKTYPDLHTALLDSRQY